MKNRRCDEKFNKLLELDREIAKLPKLTKFEKELVDADIRFESTYHSNRLEGNKLSPDDAKRAVMI